MSVMRDDGESERNLTTAVGIQVLRGSENSVAASS